MPLRPRAKCVQRIMRSTPRSETIRETGEIPLINLIENLDYSLLHDFVFQRRDSQWALPPIRFRNVDSP